MPSNKKGVSDILTVAIVLFVIALVGIKSYKIISGINTVVQDDPAATPTSKTFMTGFTSTYPAAIDQSLVFCLGLCYVITLTFAFRINTDPGLFWISLLVLVVIIACTAIFGQIWDVGTNNSNFVNERAAMGATNYVVNNLFLISIIGGFFIMLVLFAKINRGNS